MRKEMAEKMEGEFLASDPRELLEQGLEAKIETVTLDPEPEQVWEAQWQAFLKTMESSPSHTSKTRVRETAVSEDDKIFLFSSMEPEEAIEGYPQSFSGKTQFTQSSLHLREKSREEEAESPSAEVSRRHFRQFSYAEAKDLRLAYVQLRELCCQWLKPERHTKEEILELVILEQFLAILPQEMQDRVKEHSLETCAQAVALVEEFLPMQHEDGSWEKQDPGLCQEVAMSFSNGRKDILGDPRKEVWNTVTEEGEENASLVGEHCVVMEEGHTQEGPNQEDDEILERIITEDEIIYYTQAEAPYSLRGARGHSESNQKAGMDFSVPSRVSSQELNEMLVNEEMENLSKNKKSLNLVNRERTQVEEKPFKCSDCGKSFRMKSKLVQHHQSHTGEKPYGCLDCDKFFSSKYCLFQHHSIYHRGKPYERFQMNSDLMQHNWIHTGKKSFECSDCGKSFRNNFDLVMHNWIHTGKKPFECSDCGRLFTRKSNLMRHKWTHTGKKPFECSDCGKSFRENVDLVKHNQIHTGKQPFECSDCGKSFSQNSNLVRHQLIHTRGKLFKCSQCGKTFIKKCGLVSHSKIHKGLKPFRCSKCGKCFQWSSKLKAHLSIHSRPSL